MVRQLLFLVLAAGLCFVSSAPAATIVWVSGSFDDDADGAPDDQPWLDMLEANGFTVDLSFRNREARTLDADKIAALNDADLIVVSRNSNSGDYANDATEIAQWSGITAPLMLHAMHFARSNRWLWVNSTTITNLTGPAIDIVATGHPIFAGVPDGALVLDGAVGPSSFMGTTDVGNGTLLAQVEGQNATWIAEWPAGVEFYNGSGQITGGPRMIFVAGTQEGGGVGRGEYNLTPEGETLFLNAVRYMLGGAFPKASGPTPPDGAVITDTWVNLSWSPGDFAVSHDVYIGESFEDVNTGAADTFRGNQIATSLFIGLGLPGDPYPDGLVPGTTYYWRIDEVNDANTASPWKGDVWSFSIPPRKAYQPSPADGATFQDAGVSLSWTPGLNARLHAVYFGNNFDDVNNATGAPLQTTTSYTPAGPLALETTYYWRVDEFDGAVTYKGDVWSFTTTLPGLGAAVAERWENISGTDLNTLKSDPRYPNNPDVVETVTEFAWNGPDADDYGGRIEAWLYAPATGDYTFWLATDDQGELWLSTDDDSGNVKLIANVPGWAALNEWTKYPSQKSQSIPLVGGEKYYIMALWKEGGGGDHCQVAWQGPGIPTRTIIPGSNLSPYEPLNAYGATPANGAAGVTQTPVLQWKPGLAAASSEVYFGTDADAVKNATKASPEFKGVRALGAESYSPGTLAWETTYYWRVDEVNNANPESPWVGAVWSFTTADFLIIDDIESYNDLPEDDPASNRIYLSWIDGFGTTTNGSFVGNLDVPLTERGNPHSGAQAMPLSYDNNLKFSEATLTLTGASRDWTREGVGELSLWFRGLAANAAERMYVALNGTAVVYHDNPNVTQITAWTEWVIPLQQFADQGVNLANVTSITIGFGTRGNTTTAGGTGQMYFDDIRLYRPASAP